jgi:two-component system KDP operon response regulator KdpE
MLFYATMVCTQANLPGSEPFMSPEPILVVDKEPKCLTLARQVLTAAGYTVLAARKGEQAIQMVAKEQPALLFLEICLPGPIDGCAVTRCVREFSDLPIIALSSSAESEDILRAFDAGVDDYITKPFDPKILLARLRAVLKRSRGSVVAPAQIICSNLVIDQAARRVSIDGAEIYLTETEYNLLLELARHRNQVLLHEQLLVAVWGAKFRTEIDYLRSYIHILRRKLEPDPTRPRLILSRPGVGYMLVTAPTQAAGS